MAALPMNVSAQFSFLTEYPIPPMPDTINTSPINSEYQSQSNNHTKQSFKSSKLKHKCKTNEKDINHEDDNDSKQEESCHPIVALSPSLVGLHSNDNDNHYPNKKKSNLMPTPYWVTTQNLVLQNSNYPNFDNFSQVTNSNSLNSQSNDIQKKMPWALTFLPPPHMYMNDSFSNPIQINGMVDVPTSNLPNTTNSIEKNNKSDNKKKSTKHRKKRSRKSLLTINRINNNLVTNENNNYLDDDDRKLSSITKTDTSIKGGKGATYRMVLEEPANKKMLSCHQCKNKKTLDRIIVCGHVFKLKNTIKNCTKKYCKSCLLRFYLEAPPNDPSDPSWSQWKCPCCRYLCCCAWCRKKKSKIVKSVEKQIAVQSHKLTPAISLARKLVWESRSNSREILKKSNMRNHHNRHIDIPPSVM